MAAERNTVPSKKATCCVITLHEKAECKTECRDFWWPSGKEFALQEAWDTGSISGWGAKIPTF